MSSPVAELETALQGMLALKAPGVSGSRISAITQLCLANVQSESVLISKLYLHFKKAPATHKLGVLYVVDSVTRKWMDQAKAHGQTISSAADGTFAAGVRNVTELMPSFMNDIIATAPEDQKDKIRKLVDIWDKGQTFPPSMLASFREKLNAPSQKSTTPDGTPPANVMAALSSNNRSAAPPPAAASVPAMPNIMEALANIARQNASASQTTPSVTAPAPAPAPAPPAYGLPNAYNSASAPAPAPAAVLQPPQLGFPGLPFLPNAQPAAPSANYPAAMPAIPGMPGMPGMPFPFPTQPQPGQAMPAGMPNTASWPNSNPAAPVAPPAAPVNVPAHPQMALIQALFAQGYPADKIAQVLQAMAQQNPAGTPVPGVAPSVPPPQQMPQPAGNYGGGPAGWQAPRPDGSRDQHNYRDRSPNRRRSRSRSPPRWDSHHRGNDRNGFGYGPNSPDRRGGGHDGRDRGRDNRSSEYRQRSPAGQRHVSPQEKQPPAPGDKWVEYDTSLPEGTIKVLSRTLFVGGVTCSEQELLQIFSRFGEVQSCIVNKDKRHAFVKMYTRAESARAKEGMQNYHNDDLPLRTRWGVGFGPRDCCDYSTGVSKIPITKLTDADRKWLLTAPYGGSGGRPITTGLCVEEPDIEIGAGVSSKAISRRMQTDKGGNAGPRSTREDDNPNHMPPAPNRRMGGGGGDNPNSFRQAQRGGGRSTGRREERERESRGPNGNEEPVVLGFPPGITMGPNGINFPPNFNFGQ